MRPSTGAPVHLVAPLALALLGGAPAAPGSLTGIAVARLAWTDAGVEREAVQGKTGWRALKEGDSLRTGDRIRTTADGVARFEFPWMSVTAGPSTTLHVPADIVLSTVLGQGRAEFESRGHDIVKVRTADVVIRGAGRIVVRRDSARTVVMAMAIDGSFQVEASGTTVVLLAGEGTIVHDGAAPGPALRLPEAPETIRPGRDPAYVTAGDPLSLTWSSAAASSHIQVLPLDSTDVIIGRDVGRPPYALSIPWVGTYRWRVSSRDEQGLEGPPSEDGLICVAEK